MEIDYILIYNHPTIGICDPLVMSGIFYIQLQHLESYIFPRLLLHETYLTHKFALFSLINTSHLFQVTTPGTSFAVGITLKQFTAEVMHDAIETTVLNKHACIRTKGSEYLGRFWSV
jgi:hypothetical protein